MLKKGFTRKYRPLEILSDQEIESIHRATLHVLESTGVRFESKRALKFFEEAGCRVDHEEMRVRFPPSLVEECLRNCPSSVTIKARDPRNTLRLGGNTLYFFQSPGMRAVDLDTWEPRPATLKEHNDAVRVVDALDTVHLIYAYEFYMDLEGIPPCMVMLEGLASGIRHSTKALATGYSKDSEVFAIEMAKAIGIDLRGIICISPPLTYDGEAVKAAFRFAEAGFPIAVCSGAMYGATGPVTLTGSLISSNAELMAGLALIQLIKPGTGIYVESFTLAMDMLGGHPAFGNVAGTLHNIAFNQIWRHYGIPRENSSTGAYSSSKKIDFQNAYERSMSALSSALSGANALDLHGCVHAELTYHPVMSVLDNDIAGWIGRLIEGVEVTDETMAIDLIEEVGPIPGNFLATEHTRKWWKKEQFMPKVADRLSYPEKWIKGGKKDAFALAKERFKEILATHEPTPLSKEQDKDIEKILEEARKHYINKGLI